ncbi:LON peptidase substrate-binding domain-containing protein [Amphritea sp. HPY]|uniref:LON peptidase substrate-binding domain-containing protein n=1 Tax=Amphritea sp. HPY TaxID=3421652 RepID=UPI003D7D139C
MKSIPLFPLPVVLFPETLLPLQIFELRYRRMVKECLARNSGFAVVQGKDSKHPDISFHLTGTYGEIVDWHPLPNEMIGIELKGLSKVRVLEFSSEKDGLIVANLELLKAESTSLDAHDELDEILQHIQQHPLVSFLPLDLLATDAITISYQIADLLPFSGSEKQQMLELDNPRQRLELILTTLKEF